MFYRHPVYRDYLAYRHNGRVAFIDLRGTLPHNWPLYVWTVFSRQCYDMRPCQEAENIRMLRREGWHLV